MNRSVMQRQMFAGGGAAGLKPIPEGNMGLPNLPEGVRNNMGYMAMGGDPMMMPAAAQGIMATAPGMGASPEMMAQEGANMMDPNALAGMMQGAEAAGFSDPEKAGSFEEMMNSVSGDDKSSEERRTDLANIVGPEDAGQTPESVLALVTPVVELALVDQGIGPMAQAQMNTPVEGDMGGGIMTMAANGGVMGVGNEPPVNFKLGGEVRRRGDEDPVPVFEAGGPVQYFDPKNKNRVAKKPFTFADLINALKPQETTSNLDLKKTFEDKKGLYSSILGDPAEQKKMTQAQMLFDIANTALTFAAPMPGEKAGLSPAERLAMAASTTKLPQTIGARASEARSQQQKLDLAALQSAEKDIAADKAAQAAYKQAELKNRTKGITSASIYSPEGVSVPVTKYVTPKGVLYLDQKNKLVNFNKGTYKNYTLVAPKDVTKSLKTLFKKDGTSTTGVEIDGTMYEDATKKKKIDMSEYSLKEPSKDTLKTDTYYLEDGTPVPLLIKNGNLLHATDFGTNKAGDGFTANLDIYANGSFDAPKSGFTKQKSFMEPITDVELLNKYESGKLVNGKVEEALTPKELARLNSAITQYLAKDFTTTVGGAQISREMMLPPELKKALLTRFKKGLPIPDAATVYLQNTESDFDIGIIDLKNKLLNNDYDNTGINDNISKDIESVFPDSILLQGEKNVQLLEAQGWKSGFKAFFENIEAQIKGELTGSIDIHPVQEARKLLDALALRVVEVQLDMFSGNKLKSVTDMVMENSKDISGGTFTSDSQMYNALIKGRKNLGLILRDMTQILENKKTFRISDVIKARKGAKKVLNLIGEYSAFIQLVEKQSKDQQGIEQSKSENKAKSKFFNKLKSQIKK